MNNLPEAENYSKNIIHCKSSESMDELPDNSVDFIISGPPYWDYIDYNACSEKLNGVGIWDNSTSYDKFLSKLYTWHSESFRVLKDGRYCAINLGTIRKDGKTIPLPFDAVSVLAKIGWEFQYEIVWYKVAGGRQNARHTVKRPFAGKYNPNIRTEYILIYRKEPKYKFKTSDNIQDDSFPIDDFFKREIANNVWHIAPSQGNRVTGHPCPFPIELPLRLIRLFSCKGETVLDPFMGIGSTARAAKLLDRNYVGYELVQKFVDYADKNINTPLTKKNSIFCEFQKKNRFMSWYFKNKQ